MKDREAKIPPTAQPRLFEAILRLFYLYTAWEKPEEAEKYKFSNSKFDMPERVSETQLPRRATL